jgi:putative endonuclease
MGHTKEWGRRGEEAAARLLLGKGFEILERNYRHGRCEIDLIARRDALLVFAEVKLRRGRAFGYPEQSLREAQKQRIYQAATEYLGRHPPSLRIRFDIIAVLREGNALKTMHFEDAF